MKKSNQLTRPLTTRVVLFTKTSRGSKMSFIKVKTQRTEIQTNNQAKKPTKVACRFFLFSSCSRYVCLSYSDWYCLAKMNPRF